MLETTCDCILLARFRLSSQTTFIHFKVYRIDEADIGRYTIARDKLDKVTRYELICEDMYSFTLAEIL